MRLGIGRIAANAAIGLSGLIAVVSAANAALPPYWQRTREIERIVSDQQVQQALQASPIVSVTWTGNDRYEVRSESCVVTVTIIDVPQEKPLAGPRNFDIEVGAPECQ